MADRGILDLTPKKGDKLDDANINFQEPEEWDEEVRVTSEQVYQEGADTHFGKIASMPAGPYMELSEIDVDDPMEEEYLAISHEVGRAFDETFSFLTFQRREFSRIALAHGEMKDGAGLSVTPFSHQPYFCPVLLYEKTKLPKIPMEKEYMEWAHVEERQRYRQHRMSGRTPDS